MQRHALHIAVTLLVVLAGCGAPTAVESTPPSGTATVSAAAAPSNTTAGQRAIEAQKERVSGIVGEQPNVTSVDFGISYPPEYTVLERNETHVLVGVSVGYSVEFACGASLDGSLTEARYAVTANRTRLVAVESPAQSQIGPVC